MIALEALTIMLRVFALAIVVAGIVSYLEK